MSELLRASIRALQHPSSKRRTEAAGAIHDLAADLESLLPAIAGMLAVSALLEQEKDPYEQMLFTLVELSVRSHVPAAVLAPLRELEPVQPWEIEYIQDIFENASYGAADDD